MVIGWCSGWRGMRGCGGGLSTRAGQAARQPGSASQAALTQAGRVAMGACLPAWQNRPAAGQAQRSSAERSQVQQALTKAGKVAMGGSEKSAGRSPGAASAA